jgi:hypothetical protein
LINAKIADVETALIGARDRAMRTENARTLRASAASVFEACDGAAIGLSKTLDAARALAATIPINPDFVPQLGALSETFLAAVAELLQTAEAHANNILNGTSRPVRPPPPPQPEPPPQHVERQRIFTLQNLKWSEGAQVMTAPQYSWASPPRPLAEAACGRNLADLPGHERTERMLAGFGVHHIPVSADMCIDLDAIDDDAAPAAELPTPTLPRGGFEERIGKTRTGAIAVSRT